MGLRSNECFEGCWAARWLAEPGRAAWTPGVIVLLRDTAMKSFMQQHKFRKCRVYSSKQTQSRGTTVGELQLKTPYRRRIESTVFSQAAPSARIATVVSFLFVDGVIVVDGFRLEAVEEQSSGQAQTWSDMLMQRRDIQERSAYQRVVSTKVITQRYSQ